MSSRDVGLSPTQCYKHFPLLWMFGDNVIINTFKTTEIVLTDGRCHLADAWNRCTDVLNELTVNSSCKGQGPGSDQ